MPPTTTKTPELDNHEPSLPTENTTKPEPSPVLRLHLDELSHPATSSFLSLIDTTRLLPNAIGHIIKYLYTNSQSKTTPSCSACPDKQCLSDNPKHTSSHIPSTRSVTLILRSMDGVAYTTGIPIDSLHKEIHLNLAYAAKFLSDPPRFREEMIGVITHEMVHAYQWDGLGTAPGGLIEGIADFVRLKAGLAPPHWKRSEVPGRWDEGYQRTAYFLEWLEGEYGEGSVARINEALRERVYKEEEFWEGIFGVEKDVKWLFKKYRQSLQKKEAEIGEKGKVAGEKSSTSDDGVLVELEEAEQMVVASKYDRSEDGDALT